MTTDIAARKAATVPARDGPASLSYPTLRAFPALLSSDPDTVLIEQSCRSDATALGAFVAVRLFVQTSGLREQPVTRVSYSNLRAGGTTGQPQGTAVPEAGSDTDVATISAPQWGQTGNESESSAVDGSRSRSTATTTTRRASPSVLDRCATAVRDVYIPTESTESWL